MLGPVLDDYVGQQFASWKNAAMEWVFQRRKYFGRGKGSCFVRELSTSGSHSPHCWPRHQEISAIRCEIMQDIPPHSQPMRLQYPSLRRNVNGPVLDLLVSPNGLGLRQRRSQRTVLQKEELWIVWPEAQVILVSQHTPRLEQLPPRVCSVEGLLADVDHELFQCTEQDDERPRSRSSQVG